MKKIVKKKDPTDFQNILEFASIHIGRMICVIKSQASSDDLPPNCVPSGTDQPQITLTGSKRTSPPA